MVQNRHLGRFVPSSSFRYFSGDTVFWPLCLLNMSFYSEHLKITGQRLQCQYFGGGDGGGGGGGGGSQALISPSTPKK